MIPSNKKVPNFSYSMPTRDFDQMNIDDNISLGSRNRSRIGQNANSIDNTSNKSSIPYQI